ncbi:hypothetical protein P9112_009668 [Eukaryota sp. TZLM1-RC]
MSGLNLRGVRFLSIIGHFTYIFFLYSSRPDVLKASLRPSFSERQYSSTSFSFSSVQFLSLLILLIESALFVSGFSFLSLNSCFISFLLHSSAILTLFLYGPRVRVSLLWKLWWFTLLLPVVHDGCLIGLQIVKYKLKKSKQTKDK